MKQPNILITGAAAGIGKATAELFAAKGWFVGLFDMDQNGVEALQKQLGDDRAMAGRLDVTSAEDWQLALDEFTTSRGGQLDVLVNNAGILTTGRFESLELGRHHAMVDVNFKGVINGCHLAFPYLKQAPGARVINLASASAIYGTPIFASYSATKFAVRGLTEALNAEWQEYDIRVCDIMPIFVKSKMTEGVQTKSINDMGVRLTPEDIAKIIFKACNRKGFGKVHWPVGFQTRQLMFALRLLPTWLARMIIRKLSL